MRKYSLPYNVISIANGISKFNIAPKDTHGKGNKKTIHHPKKDAYAPHVMTGVDKLRAEGYTGAGINIAIIDTGIDYNTPIWVVVSVPDARSRTGMTSSETIIQAIMIPCLMMIRMIIASAMARMSQALLQLRPRSRITLLV